MPERGADERRRGKPPVFVIQRHEASHLHHDFRLEHDGVLVSWALPKGVPTDPGRNHLAVPTEDHPMSYRLFEGTIPKGEYGAGEVRIFDTGTCEFEKWRDDEVIVTLHGERDGGLGGVRKFALFRTSKEPPQWMIHLMEPDQKASPAAAAAAPAPAPAHARKPPRRASASAPSDIKPMLATRATKQALLRLDPSKWAFEMKWDGMRAIVEVEGEHTRLVSRSASDVTAWFPELRDLGKILEVDSAVLDGEVVAFAANGAPSFERLQRRIGLKRARDVEQASHDVAVSLLLFDVLALNGKDCRRLPYTDRRALLEDIVAASKEIPVAVPPGFDGTAEEAFQVCTENHLEGIIAKRRDAPYRSGKRSDDWLKHPLVDTAEVVVIGWRKSEADPQGFASLLLAVPSDDGWAYAGRVSSGFTASERGRIRADLERRERRTPAADVPGADRRDAHWVTPILVGEVSFRERTTEGRFRHPVWRGFRPDKTVKTLRD